MSFKTDHFYSGVYKFPYTPWGEVYHVCWGRYQVVKRGREYHSCGEEYNRERVRNITFPLIHIKAVGKTIKLGRGPKFLKKIKI